MVVPKAKCLRIALLCGLFMFATFLPTAKAQLKDTLYFFNSSVLVGELLNIKLERVEFDADGVGVVKIKNKEVRTIRAIVNEFRIETTDGELMQGYLRSTRQEGKVIIHSLVDSREIDVSNITSLARYGRTWKNGFSGSSRCGPARRVTSAPAVAV